MSIHFKHLLIMSSVLIPKAISFTAWHLFFFISPLSIFYTIISYIGTYLLVFYIETVTTEHIFYTVRFIRVYKFICKFYHCESNSLSRHTARYKTANC